MSREFILDLSTNFKGTEVIVEASGDGAASSIIVSMIHSTTKDPNDAGWTNQPSLAITSDWARYAFRFNTRGYLTKIMIRNATASQKLKLGRVQIRMLEQEEK